MLASTFVALLSLAPLATFAVPAPSKSVPISRRDIDINLDICISIDLNLGGLLGGGGDDWSGKHPGGTCGDLGKVNECFKVGHACDERCICIPPPPNQCNDQCSIMQCQSQGSACNPDCSCKPSCDCQDQFECWLEGGTLNDNCQCIVPSGSWSKKSRSLHDGMPSTLCAAGFSACPLPGSAHGYDCLDTTTSIDSCGGCASEGKGQDCSAIEGVTDVTCSSGRCMVHSCAAGYEVSMNGTACETLEAQKLNSKIFVGSLKGVEKFWGM